MAEQIVLEQLGKKERELLLKAFDYNIDNEGYVLNEARNRIKSEEIPETFIHIDNVALTPGSLKVIEATPTAISKFFRELEDKEDK
jgi:hypothetical protein